MHFIDIPGYSRYLINGKGDVVSKETGRSLSVRVSSTGLLTVTVKHDNKHAHSSVSIFRLLALAFVDASIPAKKLVAVPRDGDNANTTVANIEIITQNDFQKRVATCRRESDLLRFGWNGSGELVKSPKPGFYWIPFVRYPVAISKEGALFNFVKNRLIKPNKNHKGYLTVGLWNDDLQKYIPYPIHRLVARVFIKVPKKYSVFDISELQVNHKDGVKENNDWVNLEWCINLENMKHARQAGLFSNETPVLARDVRDGTIKRFASISECAKYLNLDSSRVHAHLNSIRSYGRITFKWHVLKIDDSRPWPILLMESYEGNSFKWLCNVLVTEIATEKRMLFCNYIHACNSLNINIHSLKGWFVKYGKNMPYKGYLFTKCTDEIDLD